MVDRVKQKVTIKEKHAGVFLAGFSEKIAASIPYSLMDEESRKRVDEAEEGQQVEVSIDKQHLQNLGVKEKEKEEEKPTNTGPAKK